MEEKIIVYDKNNNAISCDIVIKFDFCDQHYIVYTDNSYNEKGEFNLYKALVSEDNKLCDVIDVDVIPIFDKLILDYKKKVVMGEL